jgi:hypothetical protein
MADNTTPEAVTVGNTKIRPAADLILQIYYKMKILQALYTSQNWAALFPSGDPTGVLIDGSAQDGRNPITNANVNDVITALGAFLAFMEATSNQQLTRFLTVAVNPERP